MIKAFAPLGRNPGRAPHELVLDDHAGYRVPCGAGGGGATGGWSGQVRVWAGRVAGAETGGGVGWVEERDKGAAPLATILIDGHVHLHRCFDRAAFLAAAAARFRAAARELGLPASTPGCMLLAETPAERAFAELSEGRSLPPGWRSRGTAERESILLDGPDGERIVVIAGRQLVTREGLEVIAVGTVEAPADGGALGAMVDEILGAGTIAVVPWGFGKWWGARGRVVEALLTTPRPGLFLGDNSGRPEVAGEPVHFQRARDVGIGVLPGSDPLPFPWHARLVARYGFVLPDGFDAAAPAGRLRAVLRDLTGSPRAFGRRAALPEFVRSQIGMQVRKRIGRTRAGEGGAGEGSP